MSHERTLYGWENLKSNRCPHCNHALAATQQFQKVFVCDGCGFVITERRKKEIENNINYKQEVREIDKQANAFLRAHGIKATTRI